MEKIREEEEEEEVEKNVLNYKIITCIITVC